MPNLNPNWCFYNKTIFCILNIPTLFRNIFQAIHEYHTVAKKFPFIKFPVHFLSSDECTSSAKHVCSLILENAVCSIIISLRSSSVITCNIQAVNVFVEGFQFECFQNSDTERDLNVFVSNEETLLNWFQLSF